MFVCPIGYRLLEDRPLETLKEVGFRAFGPDRKFNYPCEGVVMIQSSLTDLNSLLPLESGAL